MLSRGRSEAGGVGEDYELRLWIHHGTSGMPELPKTGDVVEYDNTQWQVVTVDPTYSSEGLIASKLICEGGLMAKKFRGPEIVKEIDDALNKGLARFIITTQSKLSAANPVDTGRMASSWFIGKGVPNRDVAPERDGPA